jgi:hypothetical protein
MHTFKSVYFADARTITGEYVNGNITVTAWSSPHDIVQTEHFTASDSGIHDADMLQSYCHMTMAQWQFNRKHGLDMPWKGEAV